MNIGTTLKLSAFRALALCVLSSSLALVACGGGGGGGGEAAASTPAVNAQVVANPPIVPVPPAPTAVDVVSGPTTVGAISARFSVSRISGVAPLSVFFDASGTTSTGTSKPFHDLEYRWDFGDVSSGTWNAGSRAAASRNVARGPMASHVFETPGVYTVTMVATDGTNAPVNTVQVTVSDPNAVFAANTICFSTSGTFTGCPAGAAQQTISDFAAAINNNQATKKRLLFHRGETWSASGAARITSTGPGIVGTFGSGSAPKWTIATSNAALYLSNQSTAGIKDWRVMDIEMDGQNRDTRGVIGDGGIDQALLLRLNIHDVSNGIVMSEYVLDYENKDGNPGHAGHTMWDQFAIVDTRVNKINAGVGAFISATRFAFMGNDFDVVGGGHVFRTPYISRGVFSNNNFANPMANKHCWQFHAPIQGNSSTVTQNLYTEKAIISDNYMNGGVADWSLSIGPENTGLDERIRDVIVERNYFAAGIGTQVSVMMRGTVSAITLRNNIANMSASAAMTVIGYVVGDGGIGPLPTTIYLYNNTMYTSSSSSEAIGISLGSTPTNTFVKNNLAYAPNASMVKLLNGTGGYGLVKSNNSSDSQAKSTSPSFGSTPALAAKTLVPSDFKIGNNSYAVGSGAAVPVLSDFFMNTGVVAAPDLGAVIH